jgi:hypothetical protein
MTSYQQGYVDSDNLTKLETYEQKLAELAKTDETQDAEIEDESESVTVPDTEPETV